jgi:uncharacterized protein
MTPDVNVLVAASRLDHPHHAVARRWLEEALGAAAAGGVFTLMPMVLVSVLRLVTSPKVFRQATPIEDAVAAVGPEWPTLRAVCLDRRLTANDLPDAWLSAAVAQAGEHLVSFDRDFRRLLPRGQFLLLAPG